MSVEEFKAWAWPPSRYNWFLYAGIVAVVILIPGSLLWSASRSLSYYSKATAGTPPKATGKSQGANFRPVEKPAGL